MCIYPMHCHFYYALALGHWKKSLSSRSRAVDASLDDKGVRVHSSPPPTCTSHIWAVQCSSCKATSAISSLPMRRRACNRSTSFSFWTFSASLHQRQDSSELETSSRDGLSGNISTAGTLVRPEGSRRVPAFIPTAHFKEKTTAVQKVVDNSPRCVWSRKLEPYTDPPVG